MLKTMTTLTMLMMLVACVKRVDGDLQVKENLTLNGKDGYVNLSEGTYRAQLQMKKSKKITMVIRANEKEKVVFNIPANVVIPRNGGTMRVSSAQLGQPFDAEAKVVSVTNTSEPRTSVESCSRQILREVCHYQPGTVRTECHVDRAGRRVCRDIRTPPRRVCQMVSHTVYGVREVTYRYRGITTEFLFALSHPDTQATAATFRGSEYDADREILNWGHCRIGGVYYP